MDGSPVTPLRIGAWCVNPASGQISRAGETIRVEGRTMRLLLCLAARAGETVSVDELLSHVWPGVVVTPDSVYQAVASLRRLLGDDSRQPAYIVTVPRLGYRMVATVSPWAGEPTAPEASTDASPTLVTIGAPPRVPRRRARALLAVALATCLAAVAAFLFQGRVANNSRAAATARPPDKSVAVLPFLDLTSQQMNEEYFADGMTEELIDRLSKIPGLRVPAPTSSFYFKGKHTTIAEVAGKLGVAYVLDGSVRKSGTTLRVAARLIRADNGFVVWSQTYDRPMDDVLRLQDDIAGEVSKALTVSIDPNT